MSNGFSPDGIAYCIIYSFGKSPRLTTEQSKKIALSNWSIKIYGSEKGRRVGIRALQHHRNWLVYTLIYTCELSLAQLMNNAKTVLKLSNDNNDKRVAQDDLMGVD